MANSSEEEISGDSGAEMELEEESIAAEESSDSEEEEQQEERAEEKPQIEHKTLYVQFPCKLPKNIAEELVELHPTIKKVRTPRQAKARFCFLDFETEEECAAVEELFKTTQVLGMKLITNRNRKIDNPEYREKLQEKKIERKLAKKEARKLKKEIKKKKFSNKLPKVNKLIVTGIPENVTEANLKKVFSKHVEFSMRLNPTRIAFVSFSSPKEAHNFIKNRPKVQGQELNVKLASRTKKFYSRKKKTHNFVSTKNLIK